jgi:tRNA threonylcarbamoyladenosine biosynthesis protein TsaE
MHCPILESRLRHWPTEAETAEDAQRLALALNDVLSGERPSLHIDLLGDLGAGKTTWVRHLAAALGVAGRVKSPTYTLMETHAGRLLDGRSLELAHFDFYRFQDPQEWEDAGFRDVFAAPGLKLCEWPQQALGCLPTPDIRLHISSEPDGARVARWEACSALGQGVLQRSWPHA